TVLYTNSFGYGSFLIAQNRERLIAALALSSLIVNVVIAYFLITLLNWGYEYIIVATMFAYTLYTFLCTFFANRILGVKKTFLGHFSSTFPAELFLPFLLNLMVNIFDWSHLIWSPFVIFVALNWKRMR